MRPSRSDILPQDGGTVHKFWRCHNREYYLRDSSIKALYLRSTISGLTEKKLNGEVKIQAYCVMDNHSHMVLRYTKKSKSLSDFMRMAHSQFGRIFNKRHNRSGKVANERPKTPLIQDQIHAMRVHMYVEANPIRAGICKFENLKLQKFNTFRFYAFGIVDEFTKHLDMPDWYLQLGSTPEQRQCKYRRLFYLYLKETGSQTKLWAFALFIGDQIWQLNNEIRIKKIAKEKMMRKIADPGSG